MRKISYLLLLLGLVITQTVKAEKTAKAIWTEGTEGNTTMTFVYDDKTYDAGDSYGGAPITNVWEGNKVIGDVSSGREWTNTVKSSLTKVVFAESFKDARPTSCAYWFNACTKLSTIEGLSNLNTSGVNSMKSMFRNCESLESLDVSGFDTRLVTTMYAMFSFCQSLKSLDVSGFNTSQVTTMEGMFSGCQSLESLDLSGFNTSKVTTMKGMFYGCQSLESLDVSGFNTSQVTTMENMFNRCQSFKSLDLSGFNTSLVTTMNGMFYNCSALTSLDVSGFNTSNVTTMISMFNGCSNLTTIVVGNGWNTNDVTSSDNMFKDCTNLVGGKGTTFNSSNSTDKTYAHIDGGTTNPGYLTDIADFFKLEITSAKMATLYYDKALKIPAGVNVYYCSGIDETKDYNVITHEITDAIPTNTAVFLSGNEGNYLFRKTTDAVNAIEDNIIEGTTVEITVTPRQVLTLGHDSKGRLGFHYFTGTTIPAYKAYIPANKISASASAISFFPIKYFEDEATDISKLTEIGKVENDAIYDLAGRKVKAATKGIFIKNGKKFIVK